jgi:hypothetical protein
MQRLLELSKTTEESSGIAFAHTATLAKSPENSQVCLIYFVFLALS